MTQTQIEKLTPEQEALIPIIRDEWIKIALDISPTDKQQAEAAICLTYECAGLKPPQQILWFDNPLAAAMWILSNQSFLSNSIISKYAYHGVVLPEKYGQVHPNQWQANWLLEEENAELRRVIIQGIGYEKIIHELQAIELDSWQEYTLLKINRDVDLEPIFVLKMTCPSTGFIHVLRVPPDMTSAREAICWINWGVDPENFSIQT